MNLKQLVAQGSIAAVLGGSAFGAGVAPAKADPWEPDGDHDEWVDDNWRDEWRDNQWRDNQWRDNQWRDNQWRDNDWREERRNNDWGDVEWKNWDDRQDWKRWNDHDWDKWWGVNKWRNDDRPPWGWGPPPAVHWRGHPPHWIDYWGFRVFPVWFPHIKVFGFWLFGIFIPVFVIW